MNVVVVAAHPDDEILGAGATLARHVQGGDEVHAVVLADGALSRYEDHMVGELQAGGVAAARHIGFASLRFEAFPDQRLDQVAIVDLTQHVEHGAKLDERVLADITNRGQRFASAFRLLVDQG